MITRVWTNLYDAQGHVTGDSHGINRSFSPDDNISRLLHFHPEIKQSTIDKSRDETFYFTGGCILVPEPHPDSVRRGLRCLRAVYINEKHCKVPQKIINLLIEQ